VLIKIYQRLVILLCFSPVLSYIPGYPAWMALSRTILVLSLPPIFHLLGFRTVHEHGKSPSVGWVKLILPIVPPLAPLSPMIVPPPHPQTVSPISAKACRGQPCVEEGRTCGRTRIKLDGLTANPLKGVRIRCTVGVQVRGNNQPGIKKVPRIARLSTSLSIVSAIPS
jgi:hypothetical protein